LESVILTKRLGLHREQVHRQQVVFWHDARYAFAVDGYSSAPQPRGHAPISVTPPMFQGDPLNGRPDLHAFCHRLSSAKTLDGSSHAVFQPVFVM